MKDVDLTLRPKSFADFIGQEKNIKNLKIYIQAAKERNECLDHILLYGPPGLGKTTIAHIVAAEMGVNITITSGPILEKKADLAAILTNMNEGDILFIDEIHRLNRTVEECLYPALEDYAIDIIIGEGPHANTIRINLKPFTLIGATTRLGLITSPLRDRFGITMRLEFYSVSELVKIIKRNAKILGIDINNEGAVEIAKCSRGTPRIANNLLRRIRDIAQIKGIKTIDKSMAKEGLSHLDIDEFGLDYMTRMLIETIIKKFNGGPVGLKTLAMALNEEPDTIEDVYEPFLITQGLIERTPRGRVATLKARKLLGYL